MRIITPRLELIAATLEIVTTDLHRRDELPRLLDAPIGDGWPPPLVDVAAMERMKRDLLSGMAGEWTCWYGLLRSPRVLLAFAAFKGEPADGVVEMGYSVLEKFQRRGLATEMVTALSRWALRHDNVERVRAETLPELIASQRVLLKGGFVRVGDLSEADVLWFELGRDVCNRRRCAGMMTEADSRFENLADQSAAFPIRPNLSLRVEGKRRVPSAKQSLLPGNRSEFSA